MPVPPFKLDPHVVIRSPGSVPILLRRGMYNVIEREQTGSLNDKMVKAFNFITQTLTDSGRIRKGTLDLTPIGIKREDEVRREKDTRKKLDWIEKWAKRLRDRDPEKYAKSWWDDRVKGDG